MSLTQECVVAAVQRHVVVRIVAQMPLANHVGGVALSPQLVSDSGQVEWQSVPLNSVDDVMLQSGVVLYNRKCKVNTIVSDTRSD